MAIKLTKKQKKRAFRREIELIELKLYQIELIKLQQYFEKTGRSLIVIFEGRDAAGKGGSIKRVLEYLNPKHCKTVALGKPTDRDTTQDYFQRYTVHFPAAGEIVLFDRSWYNRTMVEPALGFCSQEEYEDFLPRVSDFEKLHFNNNSKKEHKKKTILLKLYFSITKEEQAKRFEKRQTNPLKEWKFSEADAQMQDKWDVFTELKYIMLKKTNTKSNPWDIIRSNDKHKARITAMKLILRSVPNYENKNLELDLSLDQSVWLSGNCEEDNMKAERKGKWNYKL